VVQASVARGLGTASALSEQADGAARRGSGGHGAALPSDVGGAGPLTNRRSYRAIAEMPGLHACDWDAGNLRGQYMSPMRRLASIARCWAMSAPYRSSIARDFQPVSRIRSPSDPPLDSQSFANVCRNMCGCTSGS
jgi:hypothetical protein